MWIVPVLCVVVASLLIVELSRSMPGQETITVENRTSAYVTMDATGGDRDGWLGLGTVDPQGRAQFEAVADQGRVWRFRLAVGPTRIGDIVRTEEQLEAAGWRLVIPANAADQLRAERRSG
jgi:ribosomal protein S28E/S33